MKKVIPIMVACLLIGVTCLAEWNHIFIAKVDDNSYVTKKRTKDQDPPVYLIRTDRDTDDPYECYVLSVSKEDWVAGWDTIPLATKQVANSNAVAYAKNYTNWNTEVQAVVDAMLDVINVIREDPKLGLPAITKQQIMDKLKSKKKKPNKKDK